jgi:hypothetical protein
MMSFDFVTDLIAIPLFLAAIWFAVVRDVTRLDEPKNAARIGHATRRSFLLGTAAVAITTARFVVLAT